MTPNGDEPKIGKAFADRKHEEPWTERFQGKHSVVKFLQVMVVFYACCSVAPFKAACAPMTGDVIESYLERFWSSPGWNDQTLLRNPDLSLLIQQAYDCISPRVGHVVLCTIYT